MEMLIRNERNKYLSSDQGFCARNTSEGNSNLMLITPHITFVNNLLHKFFIAGFRKLRHLCARVLCLGKVFLRGHLLLHWDCPDVCCCLHLVRQQHTIEKKRSRYVLDPSVCFVDFQVTF